jgi:hypothetical protein
LEFFGFCTNYGLFGRTVRIFAFNDSADNFLFGLKQLINFFKYHKITFDCSVAFPLVCEELPFTAVPFTCVSTGLVGGTILWKGKSQIFKEDTGLLAGALFSLDG